jgi:hypothetical protein
LAFIAGRGIFAAEAASLAGIAGRFGGYSASGVVVIAFQAGLAGIGFVARFAVGHPARGTLRTVLE